MKKSTLIFIISLFYLFANGQTSISDYLDVSTLKNQGITGVNFYTLDRNEKNLIERNEFNSKGRITKEIVYCNSLNDPTDEIQTTSYKYDKSDTLLIGLSYGLKKGDTIDLFYSNTYSYVFNNNCQLFKRKTIDSTDMDIEEETHFYNISGQLNEKRMDFYNESGDTIEFYFTNKYERDYSGNLIKDAFISNDSIEYERLYSYNSFGKMLVYKFKGIHTDSYDIDQIKYTYNKLSKPSLKEVSYAGGEKVLFKYTYSKNSQLIKVLALRNYIKHKHFKRKEKIDPQSPPPPPNINDYNKNYQKDYKYYCAYDIKGHLIKVLVKHLRFKFNETYLFEYE